jgi:uncharacterized membrane protein YheB (UPF0754 family)
MICGYAGEERIQTGSYCFRSKFDINIERAALHKNFYVNVEKATLGQNIKIILKNIKNNFLSHSEYNASPLERPAG